MHADLVGPLPPSEGYSYLLTVVDRFSRWPEAIPLRGITAREVARALIAGWITRFGVPDIITTDRGSQFESALWAELSALLGCARRRTTAYHPQSNGMVERLHRQLKDALRSAAPARWTEALPLVLLGIRSALKQDLGCSTAEMVYGTPLRLPGELITPSASAPPTPESFAAELQRTMASLRPTTPRPAPGATSYVPRALEHASHVFVRHDAVKPPLAPRYDGPYRVLSRSTKTITVDRGGRSDVVSIDRVKPAHIERPTQAPASPAAMSPTAATTDATIPSGGPRLLLPLPRPPPPPPSPRPLPPPPAPPPEPRLPMTRSGRAVRPPARYLNVTFASAVSRGRVM